MMELYLIRHGKTASNLKNLYIGSTDESLCREGKEELLSAVEQGFYPEVDRVVVSSMKRCIETAKLLYPKKVPEIKADFREKDFGRYEKKGYQELLADDAYRTWLESNGTLPFPEGEPQNEVEKRVITGFLDVQKNMEKNEKLALVVHGGTIMTILHYAFPEMNFYSFTCKNGEFYRVLIEDEQIWSYEKRSLVTC